MINIKEFNNQKTQMLSLCKISKCVVPDWRPVRHPDKSLPVFTMINLAWNIVSYWWMVGIIMPGVALLVPGEGGSNMNDSRSRSFGQSEDTNYLCIEYQNMLYLHVTDWRPVTHPDKSFSVFTMTNHAGILWVIDGWLGIISSV